MLRGLLLAVCLCGAPASTTAISYKVCGSSNECNSGETCFLSVSNGLCSKACLANADCTGGGSCETVNGANTCLPACTVGADCRSDLRCTVATSGNGSVCTSAAVSGIGPVSGVTLKPTEAIFMRLTDANGANPYLSLVVADQPGLCNLLKANAANKSMTFMTVTLIAVVSDGNASAIVEPVAGTYSVSNSSTLEAGLTANVGFSQLSTTCAPTVHVEGVSGSVTVSNFVYGGQLNATYSMTFAGATAPITGSLTASSCDLARASTGTQACQ